MDFDIVQAVKRLPYWSFIALLYSLMGWALFEAWLFLLGAGFLLHVLVAIPGATLSIRSVLRRPADSMDIEERKKSPATTFRWAAMSCALLYVFGAILGALVLNGSLMLLGAVVVSFTFAPWARLPLTRQHFTLSFVIAMCGFASAIAIGHRSIDTMFLPLAAWAFWLCACCALLLRANQRRPASVRSATSLTSGEAQLCRNPTR